MKSELVGAAVAVACIIQLLLVSAEVVVVVVGRLIPVPSVNEIVPVGFREELVAGLVVSTVAVTVTEVLFPKTTLLGFALAVILVP